MSRTDSIIGRLPHFYRSGETTNHLYQWIDFFAQQINIAEEDLLHVMHSHWINTADNDGSKGLDSSTKGDLDKILALYLESLGGTTLLRQTNRRSGDDGIEDDRLYRERMKGLIQVILGGPSTKTGIIDIVSANLGILGDDPAATLARGQIRIVEFLPDIQNEPHPGTRLLERIKVSNINPDNISAEIIIQLLDGLNFPIINPRLVHAGTKAWIQYTGTVLKNNELIFFPDGTGLINGVSFTAQSSGGFSFLPGDNEFYLDAMIGTATGLFDHTQYDYALFDHGKNFMLGQFDQSSWDQAVFVPEDQIADITVRIEKLHPGSFAVVVPWDSPGFTVRFKIKLSIQARLSELQDIPPAVVDSINSMIGIEQESMAALLQVLKGTEDGTRDHLLKLILEEIEPTTDLFDKLAVNPRKQISYIVNKVKAAGVFALVSYEKRFAETHELNDNLSMVGTRSSIIEDQDMKESNFDILSIQKPYPNGLQHEMNDNLMLSGVFDYTGFDSLNGFA